MASRIPTVDTALDPFINNFQTLIAATPTNYGLVAADATAITAAYTSWHAAFVAAHQPHHAHEGDGAVATKNTQRVNVLGVVGRYATIIRANLGVSDGRQGRARSEYP